MDAKCIPYEWEPKPHKDMGLTCKRETRDGDRERGRERKWGRVGMKKKKHKNEIIVKK